MHSTESFSERLGRAQKRADTTLCVGLDPDPERIPLPSGPVDRRVEQFCLRIIDATADFAPAYKLNFAFFEALGDAGMRVLRAVRRALPAGAIAIADAKRGDIGNSARFYAASVFEDLAFDAITVSPYMGADSVLPFLAYPGKGVYVLARTSNPGGRDLQLLQSGGRSLFEHVASLAAGWGAGADGEAALVVGATDVQALTRIRAAAPELSFLVPGVGAQGGDADAVMRAAWTGPGSVAVNSSRAILYASQDSDFAQASARAARSAARLLALPA